MFRGSERIRLITMLGTLCILGMIVFRSCNSEINKPAVADREAEQKQAESDSPKTPLTDKSSKSRQPPENDAVTPGPTDEDSEQWAKAEYEFQVLTDGSQHIDSTEMHAYRRVFGWVEHQSFAEMKKRAVKDINLDQLMHKPGKFRGKLIQIDLNVRQAIPVDGKSLGVETVYELRGFSEDSGGWLYFVIVPSLPEGMKSGANVEQRVRVVGYFFKIHGYLEAGSKPRAVPLKSPMLIGRIERLVTAGEKTAPTDNSWLYFAAGGFVLLSFFITLAQFISRRNAKRHQTQLDACKIERSQSMLNAEDPSHEDATPMPEDSQNDMEGGFDFRKPT